MSDIRTSITLVDNFSGTAKGMAAAMSSAASECEKMKRTIGNAPDTSGYKAVQEQTNAMGSSFSSAADSLSNLMIAAGGYKIMQMTAAAFHEAASAAIEFESAVTGIYKTVDGTPEQLQAISNAAREMALTMPSTTTEIASVMESAGQLGIATDSVSGFAKTMIDLGNATNLTADEAASSLAKFANITGMSADNYSNLGSVIVDLGNNFATTEADIVNMSTYLTSAASVAGFAETDILALSAAMSSVGINAEAGGSSMSKLISEMQTAVEVGGEGLQAFADVAGMTAQQFADEWGTNAVGALQAFIVGLNDVERNGKSMSVLLQDLDLDDIRMSNMLKAMAQGSDVMTSAVSRANTAWQENTALTNEVEKRYATLESKMTMMGNAANDLKISVGNSLTPAMGLAADVATSLMKGLSSAADTCPTFTGGVMGAVGAVGMLTSGAMTALPVITELLEAWQAFRAAQAAGSLPSILSNLTLGKVGLIIGGVAALGAAIGAISGAFSSAKDAVEDYNGTLEQCANEITQVQGQYDSVVKVFGEQSETAQSLNSQLELLNAQYEKGGGAAADYIQRMSDSTKALQDSQKEYRDKITDITDTKTSGFVIAAQLEAISSKAQITNTDLDLMSSYANYLNDTFECDIQVNYDTGELTGFDPNDFTSQAEKIAKQNITQAAIEQITDAGKIKEYGNAVKNAYEAQQRLTEMGGKLRQLNNPSFINTDGTDYAQLIKDYHALQVELEGYQSTIKGYESTVKGAFSDMGDADGASRYLNGMKQTYVDFQPVINSLSDYKYYMGEAGLAAEETADKTEGAVSDLSASIAEAEKAYSEMYEAARDSFEKQFSLFDKAAANMEMTVEKFAEAQQKQLQYWTDYTSNVEYLSQFSAEQMGMSEEAFGHLKDYIGSGTQEAAGFAANLTLQIRENGVESVQEMGNTMSQVYEKQAEASDKVAEWGSGLNDANKQAMGQLLDTINSTANKAFAEGQNVSNKLAEGITAGMGNAISAAQSVANSVQSILSNISVSVPNVSVNSASDARMYLSGTYATGTMNAAPGLALVGENGPELVNFGGGEVVYTADQTRHMMQDMGNMTDVYIPQNINEAMSMKEPEWNSSWNTNGGGSQDRTITINIGGDTIRVEGNISHDDVCSILESRIKPVLMNVLSTEILEEGEGSYDY